MSCFLELSVETLNPHILYLYYVIALAQGASHADGIGIAGTLANVYLNALEGQTVCRIAIMRCSLHSFCVCCCIFHCNGLYSCKSVQHFICFLFLRVKTKKIYETINVSNSTTVLRESRRTLFNTTSTSHMPTRLHKTKLGHVLATPQSVCRFCRSNS